MIEEKKHAKYSASNMHRIIACPGSVQLSEKCPTPPDSKYALEGVQAHYCFEIFLKNIDDTNKARVQLVKEKYKLEMIDHAHHARNFVWNLQRKRKGETELLSETKVNLKWLDPDSGGTLDAAIVEVFGRLTVIDYKYGAGVAVEAVRNEQMITYALGVAERYHWNFQDVEHIILQPRAPHKDGPVRAWYLPIAGLEQWKITIGDAIKEAKKPKPVLKAGSQCRWCPAIKICPEVSNVKKYKGFVSTSPRFTPNKKSAKEEFGLK